MWISHTDNTNTYKKKKKKKYSYILAEHIQ